MSTVEIIVKITLPNGQEITMTRAEAERLASDIRLYLGKVDLKTPEQLPSPCPDKHVPYQPYYPPYFYEEKMDHLYRPWPWIVTYQKTSGDSVDVASAWTDSFKDGYPCNSVITCSDSGGVQ